MSPLVAAVKVKENAVPTVAVWFAMAGSEGVKSAAAETVIMNARKSVSPSSSSTVTLTWCVPVASGVPDKVNPDSVSQDGSPLRL